MEITKTGREPKILKRNQTWWSVGSQHPNKFASVIVYYIAMSHHIQRKKNKEGANFAANFKNRKHTESNKDSKLKRHATKGVAEYMETIIKWQEKERGKERNRWVFIHITGTPKTIHLHTRKHYSHADQSKKWLRLKIKNLKNRSHKEYNQSFFLLLLLLSFTHQSPLKTTKTIKGRESRGDRDREHNTHQQLHPFHNITTLN